MYGPMLHYIRPADYANGNRGRRRVVVRIELHDGNTVLNSRTPGSSKSAVSISQPAGGETYTDSMQLLWQSSDTDNGDILLNAVQYTLDNGQHWLAVLTESNDPG